MKTWIGAAIVAAALAVGGPAATASAAAALVEADDAQTAGLAEARPTSARGVTIGVYYRLSAVLPALSHYYARPYYYRPYPYSAPAPFMFGFGFGPLGW